jgi:hypothetical protein
MKQIVDRGAAILLLGVPLAACELSEHDRDATINHADESETSLKQDSSTSLTTFCNVSSITSGPVSCIGSTRTYSVGHNLNNPTIRWSVASGDMFILNSVASPSVTVRFNSGFASGQLLVELEESPFTGIDCGVTENVTSQCMTPPAHPEAILFDYFRPPYPQNGDFCTGTLANLLEVAQVNCSTDYSWAISPSGFGVRLEPNGRRASLSVSRPGPYTVSVRAANCNGSSAAREIILVAQHCPF